MITVLGMTGFTACVDDSVYRAQKAQELMDIALEERIARHQNTFRNRCREGAMEEASRIVDSILIDEARRSLDTINRPPKPIKPQQPEIKELKDTLPISPFLKDTLQQDSI